jgi:hypothetical protein
MSNVAYASAFTAFKILGGERTYYDLLVYAGLNSTPNAFGTCTVDLIAPLGQKDSDLFTLIVSYATKTAKLYYRHVSNTYNMKFILSADTYFNSSTIDLTKDTTGVASLPASDFTVTTTITAT